MNIRRPLAGLVLAMLVLLPMQGIAADGDVEVPADRLAAELGRRIAAALKVGVSVEPSDRVDFIAPASSSLLLYRADAMVKLEEAYGQSAVVGLVGHWIGYMKSPRGGALLAEAQAGCAFARLGLKHDGYQRAVAAGAVGAPSGPITEGRTGALVQGYLNCLMGQEPRVPEVASSGRRGRPSKADGPRLVPALAPFRLAPALAPFTPRTVAPKKRPALRRSTVAQ